MVIETLALAFLIGWGLQVVGLYLLALLGVKLTFTAVAATDLLLLAGFLALVIRTRPQWKIGWPSAWSWLLCLFLVVKFFFIFWQALVKPIADFDLHACYTLAARMIFLNGTIPAGWPLGDETVFIPLSQAWLGLVSGSWNDALIKFYNPLLFLALIGIFYAALRRTLSDRWASLFTAALASLPLAVFHAGTGYADLPQMVYYSAATIYLFLALRDGRQRDLLLGLALLGLTVWVKRSGVYYAGIDLAVFFLIGGRIALWPALLFVLLALPWLIGQPLITLGGFTEQTISAAVKPETAPFPLAQRPLIYLRALFSNLFREGNWHCLSILLIGAACFYPERIKEKHNLFLLLVLLANLLALLLIFTFSNMAGAVLNETLLSRLLLHLAPLALFLAAQLIS